jgi:hypothetical protein
MVTIASSLRVAKRETDRPETVARTAALSDIFRYGAAKAAEKGIKPGDADAIVHRVRAKSASR